MNPFPRPYLSIVLAARHDDHGQGFLSRLQLFLRTLYAHNAKHLLPLEILIVEWNPPPNALTLDKVLLRPPANQPTSLRVVVVPANIHARYQTHKKLALYQMTAKNVGIRRAKGLFVLCTNADVIFSRPLFAFLARQSLSTKHYYRANRCDIPRPTKALLEQGSLDEVLAYAKKHILQRLGKNRWYANFPGGSPFWYRSLPMQLFTVLCARLLWLWLPRTYNLYHSLDTWACGDFTLMSRNNWQALEGYAELDGYSLHIDSLVLGAAVASGIKQRILPLSHCLYHISHANGWELQDTRARIAFDLRVPKLDNGTLQQALLEMIRNKSPLSINTPDWGLYHESLQEKSITHTLHAS